MDVSSFLKNNRERILEELFGLLKIPSISAEESHKDDMVLAANYWKELLIKAGVDYAEVTKSKGNPVVYGEKIIDPKFPTVLVYAHYDVMPVDPLDLWTTPPFSPEVRDGRIYARGADDDKGQGFIHAKALEFLIANNSLQCNVKFMIEGEEEIGSVSLKDWCIEHKEKLNADIILVSDTSMINKDTPSITCGLRGLSYMEVELTGPNRDLHSGLYGGAVANPINVLTKMVASLTDENGVIQVKGFYNKVLEHTPEQRTEIAKTPFSQEEYNKALELGDVFGEKGYSTIERTSIRPSLDVNGIWGGYTKEGSKTVIPSKAYAKISMRLVPHQDYNEISRLFEEHFITIAPKSVKVKVKAFHGGQPYIMPVDNLAYKAAHSAILDTYGKAPIPYYSGGSIPIISVFEEVLGIKSLLLGFGLDSDAIHSPNENFPVDCLYKGIDTVISFYKHFSKIER